MILVDTSAWVEFDRGTNSAEHRLLRRLIQDDGDIAVTEPVLVEMLVGVTTDAHERDIRALLGRCRHLPFDSAVDFESTVRIYRRCRRAGVTPGGLIDCMIAAVALRHGAALLTADAGMRRVAGVMGIELAA